ncbi:MAG: hypothetical protein IKE45_12005, partial [Halomonas sp.]
MEKNGGKCVAFAWNSSSITGAQKRFINMAEALIRRGQPSIILLEEHNARVVQGILKEPSQVIVSYKYPWWIKFLRRGKTKFPLLHRLLGLGYLYKTFSTDYWNKLLKVNDVGILHISMSSEIASFINCPAVFEVTSPDWAD